MERQTNYFLASHWLNNSLVLCNDITKIDTDFDYRFDIYNEESDTCRDIFQYFITDCSEDDVLFLEKSFGLLFGYSPLLDCYILCVDHYGTSWDYVYCPCYNDDISDGYLDKKHREVIWKE